MKTIIGIHGLDNKPDKELLQQWWVKAMKEGLERIGFSGQLPVFELVYWADIIYPQPLDLEDPYFSDDVYTRSPNVINYKGTELIFTSLLSKGLQKIWQILQRRDITGHANEWLDPLVQRYFREVDIYLFQSNVEKRERIRQRLREALVRYCNDDVLLIGHSMGSVIAYDVLFEENKNIRINTLVTLGSPLGFPYIAEKLSKALSLPVIKPYQLPTPKSIVKRWYNFFDPTDIVALKHRLSDIYRSNEFGIAPVDRQVVNDYINRGQRNPHNIFGYLRAKEFSMLLAMFLNEPSLIVSVKSNWILRAMKALRLANRGEG